MDIRSGIPWYPQKPSFRDVVKRLKAGESIKADDVLKWSNCYIPISGPVVIRGYVLQWENYSLSVVKYHDIEDELLHLVWHFPSYSAPLTEGDAIIMWEHAREIEQAKSCKFCGVDISPPDSIMCQACKSFLAASRIMSTSWIKETLEKEFLQFFPLWAVKIYQYILDERVPILHLDQGDES